VYFFLGEGRELLYVGKAANLRRRLLGHARGPRLGERIREVLWIDCSDEEHALRLEADIVVALRPIGNASMVRDAFTYICVDGSVLRLSETPTGRAHGAFPHLGKGKASWRAVRTNAGYSALTRLLWAAYADAGMRFRLPSKLRGTSPPLTVDVNAPTRPLHDFLSGRSARLLDALRASASSDDVPAFMRRALADDLDDAATFYRLGPRALHTLRREHGLSAGPIDARTFGEAIATDVCSAIGTFTIASPAADTRLTGKRMATSIARRTSIKGRPS
jgi:hypothetical protein